MQTFYENQSFYGQKRKTPPNTVFVQNKHMNINTHTQILIIYEKSSDHIGIRYVYVCTYKYISRLGTNKFLSIELMWSLHQTNQLAPGTTNH